MGLVCPTGYVLHHECCVPKPEEKEKEKEKENGNATAPQRIDSLTPSSTQRDASSQPTEEKSIWGWIVIVAILIVVIVLFVWMGVMAYRYTHRYSGLNLNGLE